MIGDKELVSRRELEAMDTREVYIKVYDRYFKMTGSFPSEKAANEFMLANPNNGVLLVEDGVIFTAAMDDKGVTEFDPNTMRRFWE